MSIACLKAGFHTFSEKPMGLDVTECRAMIAAAIAAGKHLTVGQVLRYIGPYRYILERIQSGELGTPLAMRTHTLSGWVGRLVAVLAAQA